jgi:hypothetical protein
MIHSQPTLTKAAKLASEILRKYAQEQGIQIKGSLGTRIGRGTCLGCGKLTTSVIAVISSQAEINGEQYDRLHHKKVAVCKCGK